MIRAKVVGKGQAKGRAMMILGLSGENVTRLAAGEPIFQRMEDTGFPGIDLVVIYGRTEDDAKEKITTFLERLGK